MTKSEAYTILLSRLSAVTLAQAQDIRDCLRYGAGLIPLPDGSVLTEPGGLTPDLREAYCNLVDGIRYLSGDPRAEENIADVSEYRPIHAGAWDPVLATLIIEQQWDTIARTAADLRHEHED